MNSSRSSKLFLIAVVFLVVAGTASAVSVSDTDAPNSAEVGSSVEATVTFTELYDRYDTWTLHGTTNLTDVTWTVRDVDLGGDSAGQSSYDGASFEHQIDKEEGISEVEVQIAATVPDVDDDQWSYDPPQQTTIATFRQVREGGTANDIDGTISLRPYTAESDRARQAIDDAHAAVDDAGGHAEAEETLQRATDEFDDGNFPLAEELANQARDSVESSEERSQLLLMAGAGLGAVVILTVVGGGFYWYRSNRTGSKL